MFPSFEIVSKQRILVIGDVMLDRYWHGDVARISPEAPVPVVRVQREENRLGGAANVAVNLRSLGANVTLLGIVGRDDASRQLHNLLRDRAIRNELVEDGTFQSIVKLRVVGRTQQMLRVDFESHPTAGVLDDLCGRYCSLVSQHDVIVFSDYDKGSLVRISELIAAAKAGGKAVFVDPKGNNWARYAGVDVITPNRAELSQVIGHWATEQQLVAETQSLRERLGVQAVLLTRSEQGMTLFDTVGAQSVSAMTREVADVTGAGDTVIATLALMVSCGLSLADAMLIANRAGALVVGRFGTASLSYDELFS